MLMAQTAGCFPSHFQRKFSYMAKVVLGEYIRRRKLTRAALDLQKEGELIIDISIKYRFASTTAFNPTFHGIHGIAPSEVRKSGEVLKAYLPISCKFLIKEKRNEPSYWKGGCFQNCWCQRTL